MSEGIVVNDLSEILKKGLDVSDIIEKDIPYSSVASMLQNAGKTSVSVKLNMLNEYMERLLEKNREINLTAITDREEFIKKHYEDSLEIIGLPEYEAADSVVDLGTGGGFPGIPLAISDGNKNFLLIDSLAKRLKVIEELCKDIGIFNVEVKHGRAEELGQQEDCREKFDLVVSRAVADLPLLCEYCLPFVKVGGAFVAYKTSGCHDEIRRAGKAMTLLGGKLNRIEERGEHCLVIIHKVGITPEKYPRRPGMPAKKPL